MHTWLIRGVCVGASWLLVSTLGGCCPWADVGRFDAARLPAPSDALVPLGFLAGAWVDADAGEGAPFTHEHWSAPTGSSIAGTIRRLDAQGQLLLIETASITAEPAGVFLRTRHFTPKLAPRSNNGLCATYRLSEQREDQATFVSVSDTRGVASVTYASSDANALTVTVRFDPSTGRADLVYPMQRLPRGR